MNIDLDSSDVEELLKFFEANSFYRTSEIAMKYDIPISTLRLWMKKCGYETEETRDTQVLKSIGGYTKKKNIKKLPKEEWDNKEWFEETYNEKLFGMSAISKMTGLAIETVHLRLKRYGIRVRNIKECNASVNEYHTKEWCYRKYIIEECSMQAMADIAKVSPHTISNWLVFFKVPIRDRNAALQVALRKRFKRLKRLKKK